MSDKKQKENKIEINFAQTMQDAFNEHIIKNSGEETMKEAIRQLSASGQGKKGKKPPRLSFSEDPTNRDQYAGIFKYKRNLLPDTVIKQIRVQNMHVAAVLRARGNHLSMFGHKRKDRFDIGIEIDIKPEFKDVIEPEQMIMVQERIDSLFSLLINSGHTKGLKESEKMTLPEFLDIQVRNGLAFGRFATEIVRDEEGKFHRFRPVDAATIFKTVQKGEAAESVRRSSIQLLQNATGEKLDPAFFENLIKDEYPWVQVVDGYPRQAFTAKELIVYSLFPSSDIEHNGYPVTPLDTIVNSVVTYQSIELYNKLYFQNGRAAKGFMVIRSDEIDQSAIEDVKQQFNASINNVNNSFRMPIFGIGKEDNVEWVSTQPQRKDGEFQFLFEQVTRNILAAFNISPEEIPGYQHLSRGTSQQALSESNNEYKLIAARDTGLRPLILKIQDFFNEKLFPLMDQELSQLCYINFSGFDAETKQQESTRLQQDMPIHYNYDEIMDEVDKDTVGAALAGQMPFNDRYQQIASAFVDMNMLSFNFMKSPSAFVDPLLKYKRDQFFVTHIQTLAQFNPEAAMAYYATRKDGFELLKKLVADYLEEEE